jgi:hypothetical protein
MVIRVQVRNGVAETAWNAFTTARSVAPKAMWAAACGVFCRPIQKKAFPQSSSPQRPSAEALDAERGRGLTIQCPRAFDVGYSDRDVVQHVESPGHR